MLLNASELSSSLYYPLVGGVDDKNEDKKSNKNLLRTMRSLNNVVQLIFRPAYIIDSGFELTNEYYVYYTDHSKRCY